MTPGGHPLPFRFWFLLALIAVLAVARAGGQCLSGDCVTGTATLAGFGAGLGLYGLIALAVLIYFLRGGSGAGAGWGSYYLIWLVLPTVIALISANPVILVVGVVGWVARRWLPDPYLFFKYSARIRSLDASVRANPANVTARRDLAVIWLAKRRPRKALPLVEQALVREPDSTELRYLLGECFLATGQWDKAVDAFITVLDREPRFRYGDPYLRAADALLALGRWQDAADGLEQYLKINRSSVEAYVKLASARRGEVDRAKAVAALDEARSVYRDLPRFQRRRQLGWYLRATVRRLVA
jgi:Tetratricopeptide repeat